MKSFSCSLFVLFSQPFLISRQKEYLVGFPNSPQQKELQKSKKKEKDCLFCFICFSYQQVCSILYVFFLGRTELKAKVL